MFLATQHPEVLGITLTALYTALLGMAYEYLTQSHIAWSVRPSEMGVEPL